MAYEAGFSDVKRYWQSMRLIRNHRRIFFDLILGKRPQKVCLAKGVQLDSPVKSNLLGLVVENFVQKQYLQHGISIKDGDTILDLGANIGTFSVAAAWDANVRIVACEAHPKNVDFLKQNILQNEIENVDVVNVAVAGCGGVVTLEVSRISGGHTVVNNDALGTGKDVIEVPAITIEMLIEQYNIDQIDLLKMDIEGSEGDVLATCPEEVFKKIKTIAMEYHDNHSKLQHYQILDLLNSKGYNTHLEQKNGSQVGHIFAQR